MTEEALVTVAIVGFLTWVISGPVLHYLLYIRRIGDWSNKAFIFSPLAGLAVPYVLWVERGVANERAAARKRRKIEHRGPQDLF